MSEANERRSKGGGAKLKTAEGGQRRESPSERALNAWRDLRPALEAGAADNSYVTAVELASEEETRVSLKPTSPKTEVEEPLANESVRRLATFELATLSREKEAAAQRVARRAAVGINAVNDVRGDDVSRSRLSEADAMAVEEESVADADDGDDNEDELLASDEAYASSKTLTISERNQESKTLRAESQRLTLDRQRVARGSHETLVEERSYSLRQRRSQKRGSVTSQRSVVD